MKRVLLVGIDRECADYRFAIEAGLRKQFPDHTIHTVLGMTHATEVMVNESTSDYERDIWKDRNLYGS